MSVNPWYYTEKQPSSTLMEKNKMESSMLEKIASHLGVATADITKIEEWRYVLFVVAARKKPRFVSKKILQQTEVSRFDLAQKICDRINADERFSAKLWDKKTGETRIYVSRCDYGVNKNKVKQCGYIRIGTNGIYRDHLTLQAGTIEALYEDLKSLKIQETPKLTLSDPLSRSVQQVVEECWECGATYTTYGNVRAGNMMCRRCA